MMSVFFAALLALAAPAPVANPSDGKAEPLQAKMFIVDDADAFWKAWAGPTPPHITTTATVTRDRPVIAIVIFTGCARGASGNCDLSVRYDILAPDGSNYDDPVVGKAWDKPPPAESYAEASLANFGFRLEPQDALGDYTIRAQLTDEITKAKVVLATQVTASAN